MMSMVLPAAKGTTARMILSFGQASATARRESAGATSAVVASVRKRRRLVVLMRFPLRSQATARRLIGARFFET